jgi:hypothetical protein
VDAVGGGVPSSDARSETLDEQAFSGRLVVHPPVLPAQPTSRCPIPVEQMEGPHLRPDVARWLWRRSLPVPPRSDGPNLPRSPRGKPTVEAKASSGDNAEGLAPGGSQSDERVRSTYLHGHGPAHR